MKFVRTMYFAVVAVIVGQGLILGSVAVLKYAGVVWVLFHLFVLVYEEPTLGRRFGVQYAAYRAEVGRWSSPLVKTDPVLLVKTDPPHGSALVGAVAIEGGLGASPPERRAPWGAPLVMPAVRPT